MRSPGSDAVHLDRRSVAFGLSLAACGLLIAPMQAAAGVHRFSQVLMGTQVDLTLQGGGRAAVAAAAQAAFAEMTRLADMMSRYRSTSALNAINLMAGLQPVPVPPELLQVLLMARRAAHASGGDFDPTVGSLRDWNFDPANVSIPSAQRVSQQLSLVSHKDLVIDERASTAYLSRRGMRLDLGGIAKLPILQAGMLQLHRHGVSDAMINGGGDVLVAGHLNGQPWQVGLRDPRRPDRLLGAVSLSHGFVAASGDYERFVIHQGRRLHHILDPKTGYPTRGPRGVVLIADDLNAINGLGAAIMVSGADAGRARVMKIPELDALIVDADGSLWCSRGMATRLA